MSFLAAFVLGFGLMLLPWDDLTLADALRESGSSIFTLGFVTTPEPIPTALDVLGGATGMVFVALTMARFLPSMPATARLSGNTTTTARLLEGR